MAAYERARIGVDPVVFTIHEERLKVLLHRREKEPFEGCWELPGGLVRESERPRDRLWEKLREMVGKEDIYLEQFRAFTEPDRDPRQRTVSIGYIALVPETEMQQTERWYPVEGLPEMAFDHADIIGSAHTYLRDNLDTVIIRQFMPEMFSLNDLQRAYEVIEDREYDNRNFRRRMVREGIVEETDQKQQDVAHRPATLYRFAD